MDINNADKYKYTCGRCEQLSFNVFESHMYESGWICNECRDLLISRYEDDYEDDNDIRNN